MMGTGKTFIMFGLGTPEDAEIVNIRSYQSPGPIRGVSMNPMRRNLHFVFFEQNPD